MGYQSLRDCPFFPTFKCVYVYMRLSASISISEFFLSPYYRYHPQKPSIGPKGNKKSIKGEQPSTATGTDMFVHCDQPLPMEGGVVEVEGGYTGSCASPGGWREGGDWNVTAECQTLCPDGIITDSSKAALHTSVSPSLPQYIKPGRQ